MNSRNALQTVIGLAAVTLLLVGCGPQGTALPVTTAPEAPEATFTPIPSTPTSTPVPPTPTLMPTPTLSPLASASNELFAFDLRIREGILQVLTADDLEVAANDMQELYDELEATEMLDHPSVQQVKKTGLEVVDKLISLCRDVGPLSLALLSLALQDYKASWDSLSSEAQTPPADTSIDLGGGQWVLAVYRDEHRPGKAPPSGGLLGMVYFAGGIYSDERWDVYVMNPDRTGMTNLTDSEAREASPAWSPDGKLIAFSSYQEGNEDVYVMNADGSQVNNLTDNQADDSSPDWSPDGRQIVFVSDRDDSSEVYVMNADGTGATNLTNNDADDYDPVWSPDGRQIAFVSDRDGNPDIFVMNADGTGAVNLTNSEEPDGNPAWPPDGKQIAFASYRDGNFEIYVMNADGTGVTRLTDHAARDENPVWSPDGTWILFTSNRFFNLDIFAVRADGTAGAIRLTDTESEELISDWLP